MNDATEHTSHGLRLRVYRVDGGLWKAYPWLFDIHHGGKWWKYRGVPNYCETRAAALGRARRKCRELQKLAESLEKLASDSR